MTMAWTNRASWRPALLALTASALLATRVAAQLPNASTTSLAMAGNNTAHVRGFAAISANPSGLGMPGSGFSLALAPVQLRMGLAPVTLGDLVDYEGRLVPTQVKDEWLDRVAAAGGESGSVGADATALALTIGNFGFQLSTTASAALTMPPGVAEAYLYGNAGRTGSAADLTLAGASVEGFGITTAGFSFALPVSPALVVGITGKRSYGHVVAVGRSESGVLEADPIRGTVEFPLIASCQDEVGCTQDHGNGGAGFGLDLGAMLDLGEITVGASVQNVLSSFAWDATKLGYRPGTLRIEDGDYETDFEELPYEEAPADLKARIEGYTLEPSLRLGAALDVTDALTVTADVHGRLSSAGIALEPGYHTGVGAELRLGFLQLRGGAAKISEGVRLGGGAGLVLGPVNVFGAAGLVKGRLADTVLAQLALSWGNR